MGADIQLVVYSDDNADPSNGASLLATVDETIQVLDGTTFSVYNLAAPVPLAATDHILIGVISRFVTTGVTSPTFLAAVDTTASVGQSWLATWVSGTPPLSPSLPSDNTMITVTGNWMIRGFGAPSVTAPPVPSDIPSLGPLDLLLLSALLAVMAARALRLSP